MSVRIVLDQHDVPFYTNLDFISGRVLLTLVHAATIAAINVKLEGESKTRLAGKRHPNDGPEHSPRTELELHKLLYKVQNVFPGPDLFQHSSGNAQYTLAAGQYEYPFRFKFPFNNDCKAAPTELKVGHLSVPISQIPVRHLKRPLPPSLGGFPGEAEIKYFIKTTVVRPKFYQENLRIQSALRFQPIEQPRPEDLNQEQYARRQHQFRSARKGLKLNLLKKSSELDPDSPNVRVDARLPSPAIITCHKPLPLRVLVEKVTPTSANIYLSSFQIELVAFTNIKAQDLTRTEISSWILISRANMDMILNNPGQPDATEMIIPSRLWDQIPLPNTVIPSFETCNLSRRYELEVRVGLSHSIADQSPPEIAVLPLRLPCEVFSGIAPPPELLQRIGLPVQSPAGSPISPKIHTPQGIFSNPPLHSATTQTSSIFPHLPTQSSIPLNQATDDLPPSYEDAMAEDIGPFDGPRQQFEVHNAPPQQTVSTGDSKSSGGLTRHPSERLFSQNAPLPPGARRARTTDTAELSPTNEESVPDIIRETAALNVEDPVEEPPPPLPTRKPSVPPNDGT